MIHSRALWSFAARRLFLFAVVLSCADVVFSADNKGPAVEGPLLVAQLPKKHETTKYELRYKFSRGDVLHYDVTHSASIHSTIDQTTQDAQTRTDSLKAWKVTDVLPEGDIEFMNVVERVHMVNQLPDRKSAEYDSTRDKTAPPGFEDAAKAVGVPLNSVRMTPYGKIVKREAKVGKQSPDEDTPVALRLPERPVAIGETWDELFDIQVKLPKEGSKAIQTRRHHKLVDVKDNIATIGVTYQVLSPIDAPIELQIVERLMSGEVKFDIAKGRVISQKMDVDKRILGFAGPTSSVQYVMKMEETLVTGETKTAAKKKSTATASNRKPTRAPQTANRSQPQQQSKSYRR